MGRNTTWPASRSYWPHLAQTLPLAEMAQAHHLIETKSTVGKVVVTVQLNGRACF